MVNQQLRALGLSLKRAPAVDDIRRPAGPPPAPRAGWEDDLVAVKAVGDAWPAEARHRIAAARAAYEAGTHEMVTATTKDGWSFLYCRPRKIITEPRSYFSAAA